jgi:hypothetical protein
MSEFIITDKNMIPPDGYSTGLEERNYDEYPVAYNAKPFALDLIPESEWEDRLAEQKKNKAQLSNIRDIGMFGGQIPATDQNGSNYCWAYSSVGALMIIRAKQNEPYVELSPHAVGCIIKGYRNQGGWGSQSLEFLTEVGCPSSEFWPLRSSSRSNDNPNMRVNAAKHKVTEWQDHNPRDKAQLVTCLLNGIPVVSDHNWWRHSVLSLDIVSFKPFKVLILNSWGNWGNNGTGILEGAKAIPDGAISPLVGFGG